MKKATLYFWIDIGLLGFLVVTIMTATVEIFIPCFVHVIFGLLLSAGALIHVGLHWDWIKNAFRRFGSLPAAVRTNFMLNLGLFLAYSAAGAVGLIARSFIFWGPLRHVVGFFHVLLVSAALILQTVHLARHWKWVSTTANRVLGIA